ncbi:hypothetical protein FIBSPDRAFT_891910 [Athelia psychrophila]|uniref:Uncharacterized protein n=1 Tax=Athelia psychrophila TaxID=1759441 RepID=A0A166J165_9AGAM|nr:hypothetical protein FIBSPDRAFT_891910 [Fibularhizoctonia sp. CBS 109695]
MQGPYYLTNVWHANTTGDYAGHLWPRPDLVDKLPVHAAALDLDVSFSWHTPAIHLLEALHQPGATVKQHVQGGANSRTWGISALSKTSPRRSTRCGRRLGRWAKHLHRTRKGMYDPVFRLEKLDSIIDHWVLEISDPVLSLVID